MKVLLFLGSIPNADSIVLPLIIYAAFAVGAITIAEGLFSSFPDFIFKYLTISIMIFNRKDFPVPASPAI